MNFFITEAVVQTFVLVQRDVGRKMSRMYSDHTKMFPLIVRAKLLPAIFFFIHRLVAHMCLGCRHCWLFPTWTWSRTPSWKLCTFLTVVPSRCSQTYYSTRLRRGMTVVWRNQFCTVFPLLKRQTLTRCWCSTSASCCHRSQGSWGECFRTCHLWSDFQAPQLSACLIWWLYF